MQSGICHVAEKSNEQLNHYQQIHFQSLLFSPLGEECQWCSHQPLYGKHNTETNHSQVSGHRSSVISYELMAPLNDQQDSQGNISTQPHYWS